MDENAVDSSTASGISFLMGLWLIAAPFLLGYGGTASQWDDIGLGFLVGGIGLIRMISPEKNTNWLSWVNVALGGWLIAAPFLLSYTGAVPIINDVILGIIVASMSLWSIGTATSRSIYTRV